MLMGGANAYIVTFKQTAGQNYYQNWDTCVRGCSEQSPHLIVYHVHPWAHFHGSFWAIGSCLSKLWVGDCGILVVLRGLHLQCLVLWLCWEGDSICICIHRTRYSFPIRSANLGLHRIVHHVIVINCNCILSSAPLGSPQDSTACNESNQTDQKQQGVGSWDGCNQRSKGDVQAICGSVAYCREIKKVLGVYICYLVAFFNLIK